MQTSRVPSGRTGFYRDPGQAAGNGVMALLNGTTLQAGFAVDSGADTLLGVRATAGSPDLYTASERMEKFFNCWQEPIGEPLVIHLAEPTTELSVVAITSGSAGTKTANALDTAANFLAQMQNYTFLEPVSKIIIVSTPSFDSGAQATILISGVSYEDE